MSFPITLHPLRIFLVENHADTREILQRYLELLGHTVIIASTKSEAVRAAEGCDCDVLLTDLGLADGEGWEVLEQARFQHPVFAIAMSGRGGLKDAERSRAAGFRSYMPKPFELEQLDGLLDQAVREMDVRN